MRRLIPAALMVAVLGAAAVWLARTAEPRSAKPGFATQGGAEPEGPALLSGPYVTGLLTDGATVCWQTAREAPGAARFRAAGQEKAEWAEVKEPKAAAFHAVKLDKLAPGAEYEVRVNSGAKELGQLVFRTAPEKADTFSFFIYGDTRSNPGAHAEVAAALLAEATRLKQFSFVLDTGDLAANGSDAESTAEQFFGPAAALLRRLPIFAVRGNHECGTDLFPRYFPAPARAELGKDGAGGDNYCFDYGSVRVLVLDQYGRAGASEALAKWVAARLAEAGDRWRLVSFHEPIYSSGAHGPAVAWRQALEPVFQAGKVHAVIAGHDHNYERSKPIGGVTHLTVGGGGAPLRGARGEREDWSVKFEAVYHFLAVAVSPEKLSCRALLPGAEGKPAAELDAFEIPRKCAWPEKK